MKNSKWIWESEGSEPDSYVRFCDCFEFNGEKTEIKISVDSNYELRINGALAAFGQYADFPYDKVYDTVDITPFCTNGENNIEILVWYYGVPSQTYAVGRPCLRYEVSANGKTLCASDESTECSIAEDYVSGKCKKITGQLGLSYTYDTRKSETEGLWHCATVLDMEAPLRARPNDKLRIGKFIPASLVGKKKLIYDLGEETVGYLGFDFKAPEGALVTVSYGEYVSFPGDGEAEFEFACGSGEGEVKRKIGYRDFSFEFYGNGTAVHFSNFMRRLGVRYLQVDCDQEVEVESIGIYPAYYPLETKEYKAPNALRRRIYETCVRTLRLCMFEHYEDCPWREQALYTLDSRNQILCGYEAFGEYRFPRSALELFGKDRRDDGLLRICAPCKNDLVIPFFSLIYIIEMQEYAAYSRDLSLATEFYGKMKEILNAFLSRMENGLIPNFHSDKRYWNFYEWRDGLCGVLSEPEEKKFDIILNGTLSIALERLSDIAKNIGKASESEEIEKIKLDLNTKINEVFLRPDGLYNTFKDGELVSELGCSVAILCGAADQDSAEKICESIVSDGMSVKTTLSMRMFKYDALLSCDSEKYKPYILSEIDRVYGYMLNCGATSFWETELGAHDFGSAGSLCHGWSALPILYLTDGHVPYRKI